MPILRPTRTSQKGVEFIAEFEGLRLKAYKDVAGVWTIGYGHTGPDVVPGLTISKSRAQELLRRDLRKFEREVLARVPWRWRSVQRRFDALVSIAFNVGPDVLDADGNLTALGKALRWRKVTKPNAQRIADRMQLYVYAGGVKQPGLVRRRRAEGRLFTTPRPDYSTE